MFGYEKRHYCGLLQDPRKSQTKKRSSHQMGEGVGHRSEVGFLFFLQQDWFKKKKKKEKA